MTLGICSAPPPLVTQRPVTVPPGRYSGLNRPSRTQSWSHDQPWATQMRYSFLYSTSGFTAGWSIVSISQRRVDLILIPAFAKAFMTSAGRSGRTRLPNAADTSSVSSARRRGSPPPVYRSPSSSCSTFRCTSALHGIPPAFISVATSMPADSAAVSSRIRPGCSAASCLRCWSPYTSMSCSSGTWTGRGSKREDCEPGSAERCGGSGGTGPRRSLARAAAAERGSPSRPSWPRRRVSAASMS